LSAIGIAGMDRLVRFNVLAMSGRAVEAAGDVDTLLLDKTGTITLGNRQATAFRPVRGVTEQELADAIRAASSDTRELIFELADQTYEKRKGEHSNDEDQIWMDGIISILRALVPTDLGERKQGYHSLLSHVLRRKGDLEAALSEISKAIEIRDKLRKKGWKWYEFHRARCRVEKDPNLFAKKRSGKKSIRLSRSSAA